MDYFEGLAKQASQLTMYDVKSYYNHAKNMVLNVSETEAKVREATNDDPWGASSTLMQDIADGTHNFAHFNEIMPTIYSRFMEKEAREWRQIYKALTLLEFLVKNGSERVVDDARAHVSTIKMLRSFHYIDEKGKDQGINVRNRASEVAGLLGDVDRIRQERRKAKGNRSKYQGQGNDGGMSFVTAGGSRYGGFGSDSVGGGGGGYDGGDDADYRPSRSFADRQDRAPAEYDEYEGADDFDNEAPPSRRTTLGSTSRAGSRPQPPPKSAPKVDKKPIEKPKEVNLFDFDDDDTTPAAQVGDDDFDDFQQAPSMQPATTTTSAPKPASGANANLFDLLNTSTPAPTTSAHAARAPSLSTPLSAQSNFMGNGVMSSQPPMASRPFHTSTSSTTNLTTATPAVTSPKPASASTFDDLWTNSLSNIGGANGPKPTGSGGPGKTIADLEKEKAMNKLWGPTPGSGASAAQAHARGHGHQGGQAKPAGGAFDDLLM